MVKRNAFIVNMSIFFFIVFLVAFFINPYFNNNKDVSENQENSILEVGSIENYEVESYSIARKDLKLKVDGQFIVNDIETNCLATALYFEASGESNDGIRAVADAIKTRKAKSNGELSVCDVVFQHQLSVKNVKSLKSCPFSWFCKKDVKLVEKEADVFKWEEIYNLAIHELHSPIKVWADHFYAVGTPAPNWARDKRYKLIKRVDGHYFYNDSYIGNDLRHNYK